MQNSSTNSSVGAQLRVSNYTFIDGDCGASFLSRLPLKTAKAGIMLLQVCGLLVNIGKASLDYVRGSEMTRTLQQKVLCCGYAEINQ